MCSVCVVCRVCGVCSVSVCVWVACVFTDIRRHLMSVLCVCVAHSCVCIAPCNVNVAVYDNYTAVSHKCHLGNFLHNSVQIGRLTHRKGGAVKKMWVARRQLILTPELDIDYRYRIWLRIGFSMRKRKYIEHTDSSSPA